MANRTIKEILSMSVNERKAEYKAKDIAKVIIDGNEFTDYGAFSFLWEKSYVSSPVRSGNGSIGNLNSYATFVTPHLQIDFSLMSIDSYRTLMKLLYSKNEFTVTCYDVIENDTTTNKMYFSTEQMPKLYTIARALNGEEWVEVIGVQEYTVEMIGTNSEVENITVNYHLNVPYGVVWSYPIVSSTTFAKNTSLNVGKEALVDVEGTKTKMSEITFDEKYSFMYWCDNVSGTGMKYIDGDEYMFKKNTQLYAIWKAGAS